MATKKTKEKKAVAIVEKKQPEEKEVQNVPQSAEGLMELAIKKDVPVETLEKIMALRREMRAERAREEFFNAMSEFQKDCPIIQKTKKVLAKDKKSVRYQYAPIEAIVEQTKAFIEAHGFSYNVNAEVESDWVTAIVTVTHELGHSEKSSFKVPIDKEGYMNQPQKFASALTFAKRYAFCNAFGILTGDEDDDANINGEPETKPQQSRPAQTQPAPVQETPVMMNEEQYNNITGMLKVLGKDEAWLEKVGKVKLEKYTKAGADGIIKQLVDLVNKAKPAEAKTEGKINDAEIV